VTLTTWEARIFPGYVAWFPKPMRFDVHSGVLGEKEA
jgi:hypothetical protein